MDTSEEQGQGRKTFFRRETPSVFRSFEPLVREGGQVVEIRVLKYSKTDVLCDIREYVTSETFTGFTKKGLALNLSQMVSLRGQLDSVIEEMVKRGAILPDGVDQES